MNSSGPALLALAVSMAFGAASAQTTAPSVDPEISVVTVLGKLHRPSAQIRRLSRSASSCAYSFTSFADDLTDEYMDHFQGRDRDPANEEVPDPTFGDSTLMAAQNGKPEENGFNDNSPAGDAKTGALTRPTGSSADGMSVACGQNDRNFAAGMNQIARNDKTLDEAYAAYDAKDYTKALETFKRSYNKVGWDEAALMAGTMYLNGQGAPRDVKEAINWYTKLAGAPTNKSHYSPYNPKQPDAATPRVEAQVRLARIYMSGDGVAPDPKAARKWYKEASELNYVPARYILGRQMMSGYGGDKDVAEGVKLLTSAAEYGYAPAQWLLARIYDEGKLVPRDPQQALGWYQQVAFNPNPNSKKPHAELALARMYDQGVDVKADPVKALRLYKLAAIGGHPEAQNALATYFYQGQVVAKNLPVARKLFIAAAAQGQADAMANAGVMLFKGEGGGVDLLQSYIWFKLAAKMGHAQAPAMAALVEKRLTPEQLSQASSVLEPKKKG